MEIYADCDICGKWDDLSTWKLCGHVCGDCFNTLLKRSPQIYGGLHLNIQDAYNLVKMEIINSKKMRTEEESNG